MSVSDGQLVNAAVTNAAFMSRLIDTSTVGQVDLLNTDPESGATVLNLQAHINSLIQNSKLFFYAENEGMLTWSAPSLSFSENIVIRFEDTGFTNTILAANSPITLVDGESAYLTLDRTANGNVVPVIASSVPTGVDIFRLVTRIGDLLFFYDNSVLRNGRSAIIGEGSGGGGAGAILADLYDPVSTALPVGANATIDGVAVVDGDRVLFPSLLVDPNRVYEVSGVGVSMVWTAVQEFSAGADPGDGETVRVQRGTAFADQLAVFNGTNFKVNETLRLFNGVNYWELGALNSATLSDNTTDSVFEVAYLASENIAIFYSITRGTDKESGLLQITTDGTTVNISALQNVVSGCGVLFSGDISGADLRLRYTTTSTGDDANMQYFIARWSDTAGGPGGPPNYITGSALVQASGPDDQIQYSANGFLSSSSDFTWNDTNKVLGLGSATGTVEHVSLAQATLTDNVASPTTIFSFAHASYKYLILEASITRSTNSRIVTIQVVTDGTDASVAYDGPTIGDVGITFFAEVSGSDCLLRYTSTSTGFNATMKYTIRRWI